MPSNRISKIRTAACIADEVMLSVPDFLRAGMTELQAALQIKKHIRKKGGDKESFRIIVASGKRSAMPHGYATKKGIRKNEIVMIDIGVSCDGYCSDITRMFYMHANGGASHATPVQYSNAPARVKKIYNIIKSAQLKAIKMVKAGVAAAKIDKAVRTEFKRFGMEKYFTHSTGHGIGKNVHEEPRISCGSVGGGFETRPYKTHPKLKSGQIITIEPGLYFKNKFGIRIEDMVLVKKRGHEVLTKAPK